MTVRKEYRVNGVDNYVVDFVPQSDGHYDIFCRLHPADSFNKGPNENHLYKTGEVCVGAGHEPRSIPAAQSIAENWMETYSNYVRTGRFQ